MATPPFGGLGLLDAPDMELETLHEVLAYVPVGVAVYEPVEQGRDFRVVYANDALRSTSSLRDIVGGTVTEAWPELAEEALIGLRSVLDTGTPRAGDSSSITRTAASPRLEPRASCLARSRT